ncbi:MAG: hypothetical protein L6R40_007622 [Gallowayella cf. fulva]|nr:MAG: hypothetical protein L6R40_007622 [Xanthomendoza cf. fulva]
MDPPGTKYRASCDGCYLAKVKCTKERPACPRCKNLALECRYSPSQRAGKSRRLKVQLSSVYQSSQWPTNSTKHGSRPGNTLPSSASAHEEQLFGAGSRFQSVGPSPHRDGVLSTDFTAGTAASMFQGLDDVNFFAPWQDYLPTLNPEHSLPESPADTSTTTTIATTPTSIPASQLSNEPEPMQLTAAPLVISCDCINTLAQALQVMEAQSPHPNSAPLTLETILEDSRDAIARGETLLQCTCFDDSTTIMLFTALIAKHLTFYGISTTTDLLHSSLQQQHSDHRPCSSSSSSATASTPINTPLSSSSSAATTARLTIGTYTLDAAGEERLHIKIMMMELQKLGSLLGKIRTRLSALPVGYEGRTYETMVDFLCMRLREATDRLRRLKKRVKDKEGVI